MRTYPVPNYAKCIEYDYLNQAWIVNGRYERCAHSDDMPCACYGRLHAGQIAVRHEFIK